MTEIIYGKQYDNNLNKILCQQTFGENHTENTADELAERRGMSNYVIWGGCS